MGHVTQVEEKPLYLPLDIVAKSVGFSLDVGEFKLSKLFRNDL